MISHVTQVIYVRYVIYGIINDITYVIFIYVMRWRRRCRRVCHILNFSPSNTGSPSW